ncbi:MAG: sulfite exporter TauE/SafE family protein [Acetobacterium sp.]
MNSNHIRETYPVKGMTCAVCALRIEKILSKMDGITDVQASFSDNSVTVDYDGSTDTLEKMAVALHQAGYDLILKDHESLISPAAETEIKSPGEKTLSILQLVGIAVIIIALYLIIQNTIGFNFVPAITPSMGYGLLFVVGLFTSLHCLGMCGGINVSQCVSYAKPTDGPAAKLRISGMYNIGRVVSYTLIGGIVGALGSVIEFSGWAKGSVAVASGLFMVVLGISMLGIFPKINKIVPRMPRFLQKKTEHASKGKGPLVVGLLTGLMPCGPLQAMQLYALGTGSFITGALSMFFFSLGTVPLMFGLGALSTMLGSRFTHKMLKVSAVLVLVLGVVMINRGLVLSGVNGIELPSFGSPQAEAAQIQDGVQLITSKVESDSFPEIIVTKGIPVKWTLQVAAEDLNECNKEILIPAYDIEKMLAVGDNVIEFTPSESGTIPYSCWMGMIKSKIYVESGENSSPDEALVKVEP